VIDKRILNVHNRLGAADSNPPFCFQWRIPIRRCVFNGGLALSFAAFLAKESATPGITCMHLEIRVVIRQMDRH
jgi:hypothetical protein